MLEFIGSVVIIYFIFTGLDRVFRGKRPKREVYIVREYEIEDDGERRHIDVPDAQSRPGPETPRELPDNVVELKRRR